MAHGMTKSEQFLSARIAEKLSIGMVWGVALGLLVSGCGPVRPANPEKSAKPAKPRILWPQPPDEPRYRFAGILRSAADVLLENDEARFKRMVTGQKSISDDPVIDKPSGIAVRFGMVYVAEPSAAAITVFDMQRRKLFRFGKRESDKLGRPQSVAVDNEGNVHVLDSKQQKVLVFDNLGLLLRSFSVGEGFTSPVGIAVNPDGKAIYVVDRGDLGNNDHKVVAFSAEGKELFRLGPRGEDEGKFNIPLAAAVGPDNTLYVADSANFRVQAFDPSGKFKFAFGSPGTAPGTFARPRSLAVGPDGNIHVADTGFNNVQIFDPEGRVLMPLGSLNRDPGPGNYALIAGIAVDEAGRLFVNDHYFKKIEVFEPVPAALRARLAAEKQ